MNGLFHFKLCRELRSGAGHTSILLNWFLPSAHNPSVCFPAAEQVNGPCFSGILPVSLWYQRGKIYEPSGAVRPCLTPNWNALNITSDSTKHTRWYATAVFIHNGIFPEHNVCKSLCTFFAGDIRALFGSGVIMLIRVCLCVCRSCWRGDCVIECLIISDVLAADAVWECATAKNI